MDAPEVEQAFVKLSEEKAMPDAVARNLDVEDKRKMLLGDVKQKADLERKAQEEEKKRQEEEKKRQEEALAQRVSQGEDALNAEKSSIASMSEKDVGSAFETMARGQGLPMEQVMGLPVEHKRKLLQNHVKIRHAKLKKEGRGERVGLKEPAYYMSLLNKPDTSKADYLEIKEVFDSYSLQPPNPHPDSNPNQNN